MAARTGRFVRVLSTLATILCATALGVAATAAPSRIVYGSYLPASGGRALPITVDGDGNTWFAATQFGLVTTTSPSGALVPVGSLQRVAAAGGTAVLVASIPSASPSAIAVDSRGSAYVAGSIDGDLFQVSPAAFQKDKGAGFVAKVSLSGAVLWSSYIAAVPSGIAFDAEGSVFVTGEAGPDFRATPGVLKPSIGAPACAERLGGEPIPCSDAFVAKISADGSRLIYATFVGGLQPDRATGIAVARDGSVFLAGETLSGDFPTTAGAFQPRYSGSVASGGDAFALRLDPTGGRLLYSTFLGGSNSDQAAGLVLDANLNAYIAGSTRSRNFPVSASAWQSAYGGTAPAASATADAFYVKLDALGNAVFSSYLGGPEEEGASALALGPGGRLVFLTSGGAAAVVERRTPGPCEPASTLILVDPQTGRVVESYGLSRVAGSTLAVDSGGRIHAAGLTRESSDSFALSLEPPGRAQDAYLVRVDLLRSEELAPACLLNTASLARSGNMTPPLASLTVSPGEMISIFGTRLGGRDGVNANGVGALPIELGGVRVTIGGRAVPLLAVSTREIRASVPYSAVPGRSEITIERDDLTTVTYPLEIAPAASGIFTADGSGLGLAAVVNDNGTLNGPNNPARRGSVVSLFATGLGAVSPPPADGALNPISPPWPIPTERFELYFAPDRTMEILFAGPAPGQAPGVFQVNARIPAVAPAGRVPIKLAFDPPGWNRSQDGVYLVVE